MKTRQKKHISDFRFKLPAYDDSYYVKRALKLEAALERKPKVVQLELIGGGEIPADTALLIRSILMGRSPGTGARDQRAFQPARRFCAGLASGQSALDS